jgi:hypothetical protein
MNDEILEQLIGKEAADKLKPFQAIMNDIRRAKDEIYAAESSHTVLMSRLKAKLSLIRERCSHPATKHYGDPAGGSDSYTECLICGSQDA